MRASRIMTSFPIISVRHVHGVILMVNANLMHLDELLLLGSYILILKIRAIILTQLKLESIDVEVFFY
jgi:hypothetical protein